MRMTFQELANATAQNSCAMAVNHAHARQSGEKRAIKILLKFFASFIDRVARAPEDADVAAAVRADVRELTRSFPLYPDAFIGGAE